MHESAMDNCKKFIKKYLSSYKSNSKVKVVDVGSKNWNGTLKSLFPSDKYEYIGIDISPGKNVDIVIKDYKYPFVDKSIDVVVSSSCFEHDEMFWLSFQEIVRVTKDGGFIYLNAPYKDGAHPCPVDCWRFLPDGFKALAKWCPRAKFLEGYIDDRPHRDCVGIFKVG